MNIKKYTLGVSVFIAGASVMIFELVGSRILAPVLGSSIYVWTSLIGVVLASLSAGYALGGKRADLAPSREDLSLILCFSAILVIVVAVAKDAVLSLISPYVLGIELATFLSSALLFAPASVFLGMVTPYAVKLATTNLSQSASTAGNMLAISTIGSIAGTFLAGFLVIPLMGSVQSLMLVGVILVIASGILSFDKMWLKIIILAGIFVYSFLYSGGSFDRDGRVTIETQYNSATVFRGFYKDRSILGLKTDPFAIQSAMYLDSDELVFDYAKFFHLARLFVPDFEKSLMLGGCAYSFPRDYLTRYPGKKLDVVEIDPGMTALARRYFRLEEDPDLAIFHEDGRVFLNNTDGGYDVIFNDAFNSFSIPHQLTTLEAVQKQYDALKDEGVVISNVISGIDGSRGKFLRAQYATFENVFDRVYLFQTGSANAGELQNLVIVAYKGNRDIPLESDDHEITSLLSAKWEYPVEHDLPVLTDNYAPVEFYRYQTMY